MEKFLDYAKEELKRLEVDYGDIRICEIDKEIYTGRNGEIEQAGTLNDLGFGIRVLKGGNWGFCGSNTINEGEFRRVAKVAKETAAALAANHKTKVELSDVLAVKGKYKGPLKSDPFQMPLSEKVEFVTKISKDMLHNPKIESARCGMQFLRTKKYFASTLGSMVSQEYVTTGADIKAIAQVDGERQSRSYPMWGHGKVRQGGFELVLEVDLPKNAERVCEEVIALCSAPLCPSGNKTVIIGASQLALQLHESCGHPTELDRALGEEISLAGASFLTPDKLGHYRYGSEIVNIYGDSTTAGGAGTFGYDDEGVPAKRFDIIKDGIFVGYCSGRESAARLSTDSNGCMRAESWRYLPIVRMVNINLAPGNRSLSEIIASTEDGLFIDTNKSWSIDDLRLNFQFGCEIAWEIKKGKLGQMYRDPVYTGISPKFWQSCDAIADANSWELFGFFTCGKGDPMQSMHVGHGISPSRFNNVQVGARK